MANTTTGIFQTLVAAAQQASEVLTFSNALTDAIYWEYQPVVATPYQTLNVIIPSVDEGDVADIGSGPLQPTDTAHDSVAIVLNHHFSTSFIIKSFDAALTPVRLREKYISPRFEALKRKVNRTIAAEITTTNFQASTGGYAIITGSGADVFDRANFSTAWANLAGAGVPVDDTANLFLITNPTGYAALLASTAFSSEQLVGINATEAANQRAVILAQYGANVKYDQHLAVFTASRVPAFLMHRYAIAGVSADPPSGGPGVDETVVTAANGSLPIQIQIGYSLKDQGWLTNLHCYWGVKVVRPAYGQCIETA